MILHRLLQPDEDIRVCHVPIDAQLWLGGIGGWSYVKANQGSLASSDYYRFTGWLVGIARHRYGGLGIVDVFEKTRQYLAESTPDLDGTVVTGPVIETSSHRYMLCVPCKIVEQGELVIYGWMFPEAT